jgi:hypothetical protein
LTCVAFSYVVRMTFADREAMDGFLAWLRDRHIADVCAAGALGAELVRLDEAPLGGGRGAAESEARDGDDAYVIEVRYRFASREAFARYEEEHAPRLRAEGIAEIHRLGIGTDRVTFLRTTGEIVALW